VAAPASATDTTGVAIPSLRPLSTLISRRILAGTTGLTIMQLVQPNPGRVREQHQGEGELGQFLDELLTGCYA
jgi:hypothetical protein